MLNKLVSLHRRTGGFLVLSLLVSLFPAKTYAAGPPYSALVAEVESDRILYAQDPDELRHPASLTKMMTLYLLFEAVARGQIGLQDTMTASAFASAKPPSKLGLRPGDTLTVEEGILGLVTQSANDAATVIAETLGGSEAMFADMMTQKAHQLGMNNTVFRNAQGLPDPDQWTTARDMYLLGKALIKNFPQFYPYFSTESFWFRDRSFKNHNHLLGKYPGADGIKTGFINSSGFNLVASAKRNGFRLVGVVFGGPTHHRRDLHMQDILDDGFAQLEGHESSIHFFGFNTPAAKPTQVAEQDEAEESAPQRIHVTPKHQAMVEERHHHAAEPVSHHHESHAAHHTAPIEAHVHEAKPHHVPPLSSHPKAKPAPTKLVPREVAEAHVEKKTKPAPASHGKPAEAAKPKPKAKAHK